MYLLRSLLNFVKTFKGSTDLKNRFICIIAQNHPMGFGGMEIHTLLLIGSLIERGYLIELIANRYHRYDEIIISKGWLDSVNIMHTDLGGIFFDKNSDARNWKKFLRNVQSHVLLFPKGNSDYGHIKFLRVCRRKFKKIFFIEHLEAATLPTKTSRLWFGLIPGFGFWWYKQFFIRKARSFYADEIIAVSNQVKNRLVQDCGYAPSKVTVITNGVSWRNFVRSTECGMAFRSQHMIPFDAFVFGMLTRLDKEKGIDIALHAIQQIKEQRLKKTFYLVIAGEGPLAEELETLTNKLNLQNQVRFIGFVHNPKEALSGYDVILFSSRLEGLPLGLLEGMAAGCIPIVTRISGMPEVVNSPDIGWTVSPENPEDLCRAMKQALTLSETTISKMRENVVRRIQQNFDIIECHRKIFKVCGL